MLGQYERWSTQVKSSGRIAYGSRKKDFTNAGGFPLNEGVEKKRCPEKLSDISLGSQRLG